MKPTLKANRINKNSALTIYKNVGDMVMQLENIIKEKAVQLKSTKRNIDIAPDIPAATLDKWQKKYSAILDNSIKEYILVISYTQTGNFALTGDTMYYDNYLQDGLKVVKYSDIAHVSSKEGEGFFAIDKVIVEQKDGSVLCLDACIDGINVKKLVNIFTEIISYANQHRLTVSKQNIPLYTLSDTIKIVYLKILCNYSYLSNEMIDANGYNTISSFSIRMEIGPDARKSLRHYMNEIEQRQKTGYLMREIELLIGSESGQWDALRYSLLQDVLYMHNAANINQHWRQDGFIGSLMQTCSLKPAQLDTMLHAIDLNNKMQLKDADLKHLRKEWKRLIKGIRYSDAYVPTLYLFCSGSIYGISNYTSFMKKEETSEDAINKQRELILHEIIENNQKTINLLAEDMNYLAEKLETAINEGEQYQESYQMLMQRLKQAVNYMTAKKNSNEQTLKGYECEKKSEMMKENKERINW